MPYASRICSIFPLWMESKALVKSTNINVTCRFFARTPSRILRMVNICEVVDLFLWKPFWFFLSMLSILGCFSNYIYIYIYEVHTISFQTFFIWALLLIVHTWNSSPLRSNLLRLQCTCCTIPTTSGRPHRSPLVWLCQWPSSQPLSSPQFSHNHSLWA